MKRILKSQQGFSLVELMVVVAIIGILAAMSVGQVNKQIAKSRQAEAKSNLASLYTAEKAFQAEWSSYCGDFGAIGLAYEGNLRYATGFNAIGVAAASVSGYTGGSNAQFQANTTTCGASCTVISTNGTAPTAPGATAVVTATNFLGGANAMIYVPAGGTGVEDRWTINANKTVSNLQAGIP